jgi:hypothetical protein
MTLGTLLTGFIFLIAGSILYYLFSPKPETSALKQKIGFRFVFRFVNSSFRPILGSIFIFIGLLSILTFCLGIDARNYTPEPEDDMNILNGIIIGICAFSLERNITYLLLYVKHFFRGKKNQG